MEYGIVDLRKYPERYHLAIHQQDRIGWDLLFTGKIAQEWLQLYDDTCIQSRSQMPNRRRLECFVWGVHIVEIILRQMIILWEQRNKTFYGDTTVDKDQIRKEMLSAEFQRLNSLQDKCRPSDAFLFRDDPDGFIKRSTVKQIATYITSSKRAINNSYNKWKK